MAGSLTWPSTPAPVRPHAVVSTRLPVVLPAASLLCRFCRKLDNDVVAEDAPSELNKLLKAPSREDTVPSPDPESVPLLLPDRLEMRLWRSASSPPPGGGGRPPGVYERAVASVLLVLLVLLELLVLAELVLPVSLVADTLLVLLSDDEAELPGGGPGGGLFWPFKAAISSCRKASSFESTFDSEMLLEEDVAVAEVAEVAVVALVVVLSRSTPSEARISLSAPIRPPPLSPRGGGGGASMRGVALVE